jgi:hypothetical protein
MPNASTRVAIAAAIILRAALTPAQAQMKLTAGSLWVNQLGSVLTINNIASNGLITGTYVTNVGCDAGQPQPMTGWYYGGGTGGAINLFGELAGLQHRDVLVGAIQLLQRPIPDAVVSDGGVGAGLERHYGRNRYLRSEALEERRKPAKLPRGRLLGRGRWRLPAAAGSCFISPIF